MGAKFQNHYSSQSFHPISAKNCDTYSGKWNTVNIFLGILPVTFLGGLSNIKLL